jgi:hypothetical protein
MDFIVAAMISVQGLASVAKIRSTNVGGGGGFDNPSNDRLAYLLGHRWVEDFLREHERGASAAAGTSSSSITNNNDYGKVYNVTVNKMYGGKSGLRELRRELNRADIRDRSRVQR